MKPLVQTPFPPKKKKKISAFRLNNNNKKLLIQKLGGHNGSDATFGLYNA
jgi:hypothetical protein